MFLGHFAVGMAAKRVAPRVSLGTLFVAAQFLDLLWPTLLLLGIERVRIVPGITRMTPLDFEHYPVSHSLLAAVGWGLLVGLLYYAWRRRAGDASVLGLAVVSHWLLDVVVHRPDLPLVPGGPMVGFGLWNSVAGTLIVELSLFAAGAWIYLRTTRPRDATGRWATAGLLGFLLAVYLASAFGAPPPDVTAIAWVGEAQWLIVLWAWWADAHRSVAGLPATSEAALRGA